MICGGMGAFLTESGKVAVEGVFLNEPTGVTSLVDGLLPSPRRTRDSMVLSRSPFNPFNTVEFRLVSGKPISRNVVNLPARSVSSTPALGPIYSRDGLKIS